MNRGPDGLKRVSRVGRRGWVVGFLIIIVAVLLAAWAPKGGRVTSGGGDETGPAQRNWDSVTTRYEEGPHSEVEFTSGHVQEVYGWMKAGVISEEGLVSDAGNALPHVGRDRGREFGRYSLGWIDEVLIGLAVTTHPKSSQATAMFNHITMEGEDTGSTDPNGDLPTTSRAQQHPDPPSRFVLPPATMYVATDGDDSNSGRSESAPLRTLARAASLVEPGDVVYVREGTYPIQVKFVASGTAGRPIIWASYPGEWAVLDGSDRTRGVDPDRMTVAGASFNVFANFEVRSGPQMGIHVSRGHDNLFTGLLIHGHHGSGIMVHNGNRNRFEHLAVYDNFDESNPRGESGEDADGISVSSGDANIVRHVVSFRNSDDGIDAWKSTNTLIEFTVSHTNGAGSHGNGNGFKAGGGVENYTVVRNSIAYNNRAAGFTNNDGRQVSFLNNTAIGNGGANFVGEENVIFTNNLSMDGSVSVEGATQRSNSWNMRFNDPGIVSRDPSHEGFLSLRQNSRAIDAGTDTGYPFSGDAPDLGALEFGSTIADIVGDWIDLHLPNWRVP